MSRTSFLARVEPFRGLSHDRLRQLARRTTIRRFAAGVRILARGQPGDSMYVICSGEVRIPFFDEESREKYVAHLGEGDFFGEMALLTGEPRRADVFATTDVECLVIHKEPLYDLLEQEPDVAAFLTELLGDRLLEAGEISKVGKYRLIREIGRGGASVVYEGVHPELKRTVAVKMLNHSLVFDPEFGARFLKEAEIIAQLEHENIVRVFDCESAYATRFIIMEMVPGVDLGKIIETRGPMDEETVRRVVVQLASALDYAHRRGIVHRDLKPDNVIVHPGRPIKLTDFGLAATVHERGPTSELVGTVQYMAPEQGLGQPCDGRSDIYALGIVAFEMLTGRVPFEHEDPYEVIEQKVTTPAPPVRDVRPNVSDLMARFIERAVQPDPADRFPNCTAVLEHFGEQSSLLRAGVRARTVTVLYDPGEEWSVRDALDRLAAELGKNPNIVLCTSEHDRFN